MHRGARLLHGLLSSGLRFAGASFMDIPCSFGIRLIFSATLLDGSELGDERVGGPALALDASDAGAAAAFVNFRERLFARENLVQIADRTLVAIARIGAANARRIGDHGLQPGANALG